MKKWVWRIRTVMLHPLVAATYLSAAFLQWRVDDGIGGYFSGTSIGNAVLGIVLLFLVAWLLVVLVEKVLSNTSFVADSTLREAVARCISESQHELDVVSPYLEPGNVMVEALLGALRRGVRVRLVVHSSQLKEHGARGVLGRLAAAGVAVRHHPHLHAKLYASERFAVVPSLNLVSGSLVNSLESGVETNARDIRRDVRRYIDDVILRSDLVESVVHNDLPSGKGFCIRTGVPLAYNPYKPVEYREFKKSRGATDGKYCHECGEPAVTSLDSPFCKKHRAELASSRLRDNV